MPAEVDLETMSFLEDMGIATRSKKTHELRGEEEHKRKRKKCNSAPKSKVWHRQTFAHLIHDTILRLNCAPFPSRHTGSSRWAIARDLEKQYGMRLGKKFDAKLKLSLAKLVSQGKLIPIGNTNIKYVLSPKFAEHSHRQGDINCHANSHSNLETSTKGFWSHSYNGSGSSSPHHRSRSRHRRSQSRNPRSGSPHKRSKPSSNSKSGTEGWHGGRSGGSKSELARDTAPDEGGPKSKSKSKGSKSKSLRDSWFGFGGGSDGASTSEEEESEFPFERENNGDSRSGASSPQKKSGSGNFTNWLWPTTSASNEGKVGQTSQKHTGFGGVFGRFKRGRSPEKTSSRNGSRHSSRGKSAECENLESPRSQSYVASPRSPNSGLRGGLGRVLNRFKRGRSREKRVSRSRSRHPSRARSAEARNPASPRSPSSGLRGGLGRVFDRFRRGRSQEKTTSRSRSRQTSQGRSAEAQNLTSPRSQSSGFGRVSKRLKRASSHKTRSRSQSHHNSRGRSAELRNLASPRSQSSSGVRQGLRRGRPRKSQTCSTCGGRSTAHRSIANPSSQRLGLRRGGLRSALKRRNVGQPLEKTANRGENNEGRGRRFTGCQYVAGARAQSLGPPSRSSLSSHCRSTPSVKCPPALEKLRARPRMTKAAILEDNSYPSAPQRSRGRPRITKVATIVDNPQNIVEDSERDSEELQGANKDSNTDAHGQTSSAKMSSRQSCKRQELPASVSSTSETGRFLNAPLSSRLKTLQRE